ncbi:hypothetical protein P171DRAFT_280444 [Karstenula rhodostoma CBS 690.94]|uniref:Uncharacterized protein n=1 Tax=Karstenula rhodostoma CBS 690.94 TaxID=1392251 RepID=A0A9P4PKU1_9PLEO|nr:hypothetical protein P171DRAFT_280444 [Karstenula rhodostoma CBS 690.94]
MCRSARAAVRSYNMSASRGDKPLSSCGIVSVHFAFTFGSVQVVKLPVILHSIRTTGKLQRRLQNLDRRTTHISCFSLPAAAMFTLKQRKSKPQKTPKNPRALDIAKTVLKYIAIWVLAPILLGFLAMLAILYFSNDGLSKSPVMGVKVTQSDWVQRNWIGNTTQRGYAVTL